MPNKPKFQNGFYIYKKSFLNDDVKLFVEKSKGYEEEHLSKDVIAWKEIELPSLDKEKVDDND